MEEAQRDLKEGNLYYVVSSRLKVINWIQRKIYLYNVTFGLYMLDWWERCLFNALVVVLMWFIFYNGSRHVTDFCERNFFAFSPPYKSFYYEMHIPILYFFPLNITVFLVNILIVADEAHFFRFIEAWTQPPFEKLQKLSWRYRS